MDEDEGRLGDREATTGDRDPEVADRDLDAVGVANCDLEAAAEAIAAGELVVYPTETVYGLGADGTDADAVEAVFEAKRRPRDRPISIAVPDLETAAAYADLTATDRAFAERFLPGPVTVVVEADPSLPDLLTAGGNRIGIRIPDHPIAMGLLERVAPTPVTATSANESGDPSPRSIEELPESIRTAAIVLDGGTTPGGGSTVVDPSRGVVHRRGRRSDAVDRWLKENKQRNSGDSH